MFGKNKISQMPNFINNYDLWDKYLGKVWYGLISDTNIDNKTVIIDLAPGASIKIEYALSYANFCGKLYIIEPHEKVGEIILNKSKAILPNATITLINKPFLDVAIKEKVDIIMSNHPFDDFISAYLIKDTDLLNTIFDDISKEDKEALKILQKYWSLSKEKISKIKSEIISDFMMFIEQNNPQRIICNQYKSSYFENNNLNIINMHAVDLFKKISNIYKNKMSENKIQEKLNQNENYNNRHIGEIILNAENWMAYDKI